MKTLRYFLAENLELTDLQRSNAKNGKMHALVRMHPKKFLELTTQDDEHTAEIKRSALPLHQYNKFSREKEILVAPFLRVDHRGKVTGHEGRHRAAALLNAGHDDMHVYLQVRDNDSRTPEREIGFGHVPKKVVGQFGRGELDKDRDVRLVHTKVGRVKW